MSTYRGTAEGPDRAKAIGAVVAVHVALAFVILTGLNVHSVSQAVDRLKTFNFQQEPPPPPKPPPAKPQSHESMKKAAGAPATKAEPSPVVVPPPRIPAPSPLPGAKVAGTGNASSSGAAASGNGTGAGSIGNGPGGGGTADYSRFTPARKITKIPDREYRSLAATGLQRGVVGVTVKVNTDGSVSNCRIARSSGNRGVDGLMCQLTLRYIRFDPARDPSGRPVAQDITFFPNWYRP